MYVRIVCFWKMNAAENSLTVLQSFLATIDFSFIHKTFFFLAGITTCFLIFMMILQSYLHFEHCKSFECALPKIRFSRQQEYGHHYREQHIAGSECRNMYGIKRSAVFPHKVFCLRGIITPDSYGGDASSNALEERFPVIGQNIHTEETCNNSFFHDK